MSTSLNAVLPRALRSVIETLDTDGRLIVMVGLSDGTSAKLFRPDFDALMSFGLSPNWFVNDTGSGHAYVRVRVPAIFEWSGGQGMVARLILRPANRRASVRYRDGDPRNLRRDNLEVGGASGRSKGRERGMPSTYSTKKRRR